MELSMIMRTIKKFKIINNILIINNKINNKIAFKNKIINID
jgi:hypothetical protein